MKGGCLALQFTKPGVENIAKNRQLLSSNPPSRELPSIDELRRKTEPAPGRSKGAVLDGEHDYTKAGQRWACRSCQRSWVRKPTLPKQRMCLGRIAVIMQPPGLAVHSTAAAAPSAAAVALPSAAVVRSDEGTLQHSGAAGRLAVAALLSSAAAVLSIAAAAKPEVAEVQTAEAVELPAADDVQPAEGTIRPAAAAMQPAEVAVQPATVAGQPAAVVVQPEPAVAAVPPAGAVALPATAIPKNKPGASGKKAPLKRGRHSATLTGTGGVVFQKSRLPGSFNCRSQIVTGHEVTRRKPDSPQEDTGDWRRARRTR